MSLADVSHGPDWVIWIVFAIFVALAITFLTGHGSSLCDRRDYFCGRDCIDHSWQYGVQAAVARGFPRIMKRKLTGDQMN